MTGRAPPGEKARAVTGSVHRILALRLALVGLAVAATVGAVAWHVERDEVAGVVLDRLLRSTVHFNYEGMDALDPVPDPARVQAVLDGFAERPADRELGFTPWVRIADLDGRTLAQFRRPGHPTLEAIDAAAALPFAGADGGWELRRIAGRPHLRMRSTLVNRADDPVATVDLFFEASPAAVARLDARAIRAGLIAALVVLLTTAAIYPVIALLLRRIAGLSFKLMDSHLETVMVLGSAIAKRDSDTDSHNYRVTLMSVRLAEAAHVDPRSIRSLLKGALLHDVGKIGIPDRVLLKPGELDDGEYEIMRGHVELGLEIIERSGWLRDAADVVGYHHERIDGKGYPHGLAGDEFPLLARIFAIADVFDALTSKRPYKEAFPFDQTMTILEQGRGKHFDAELLDIFGRIAPKLHAEISGREGPELRVELDGIVRRYFSGNLEAFVAELPEPLPARAAESHAAPGQRATGHPAADHTAPAAPGRPTASSREPASP